MEAIVTPGDLKCAMIGYGRAGKEVVREGAEAEG